MKCKYCGSEHTIKNGGEKRSSGVYQAYKCKDCNRRTFILVTEKQISMGLTETEIRAKHDDAFKIRKAAEQLKGDLFFPEYDFLKMCGLSSGGYRHLIDNGQFDQFRGRAGNITYWSNPESILKLKNEGVLK